MSHDPVREWYDRYARLYDGLATAPPIERYRRRMAESLSLQRGETVVEMGCGTGGNLPVLRDRVGPEGRVVGIDFTRGTLDRARTRIRRNGWDNVHLVHADATDPPVSGEVDAIAAAFVTGLFDDPGEVVERWCNLLGPGGRIALLNFQRSEEPPGRWLVPLYDLLVAVENPGGWSGAADRHGRRVREAREAVARRAASHRFETFVLGYLGLLSGQL